MIQRHKEIKSTDDPVVEMDNTDEHSIRDLISEHKYLRDAIEKSNSEKHNLEKQIEIYQTQLTEKVETHLNQYQSVRTEDELYTIMKQLGEKRNDNQGNINTHRENLKNIADWQQNEIKRERYLDQQTKLETLRYNIEEAKQRLVAAESLKNHILKSESISMGHTLDTINSHASCFLDGFFEEPLTVQLEAFKCLKSKKESKPVINVRIQYKGNECDLQCLSGGEMARVSLAYTLALSEIFGSSLLLLDECTASLDQETTTCIFNTIKEHLPNKRVIIIAHQIITGSFDRILKLT